jgi:hypothetical protein
MHADPPKKRLPSPKNFRVHDHATREIRNEDGNVTGVLVYPIRLIASVISSCCVKSTRNGITKEKGNEIRFKLQCPKIQKFKSVKGVTKNIGIDDYMVSVDECRVHQAPMRIKRNKVLGNYTVRRSTSRS